MCDNLVKIKTRINHDMFCVNIVKHVSKSHQVSNTTMKIYVSRVLSVSFDCSVLAAALATLQLPCVFIDMLFLTCLVGARTLYIFSRLCVLRYTHNVDVHVDSLSNLKCAHNFP